MPRLLAAPKRRAGGTDFRSAGFSISVFSFSFINAPFYHALIAFLSQEGQEGQEGQDIFEKHQKHWEIEGFLRGIKQQGRNQMNCRKRTQRPQKQRLGREWHEFSRMLGGSPQLKKMGGFGRQIVCRYFLSGRHSSERIDHVAYLSPEQSATGAIGSAARSTPAVGGCPGHGR